MLSSATELWSNTPSSPHKAVELVPHLQRFLEMFLRDRENALPTAVQGDLFEPLHLTWVQVNPVNLVARSIDEILMLPARVSREPLKWSDVAIVAQTHRTGSDAVSGLEAHSVVPCFWN